MKRLAIRACIVAAVLALGLVAIGVRAGISSGLQLRLQPFSPFTAAEAATSGPSDLLAQERAVLKSRGLSPARANLAIEAQSQTAQTAIVSEVEAALGQAYGGAWFETRSAKLRFGVVTAGARRIVKALATRDGLSRYVGVTPVRWTWGQLLAAQASANKVLAESSARLRSETSILPERNAVLVSLGSSTPWAERDRLEHEASASNVNIFVTEAQPAQLLVAPNSKVTKCNEFKEDEAACNPSITSGVTTLNEAEEFCTAGPMAIPIHKDLETYLLTAGHCINNLKEMWSAFNQAKEKLSIGLAQDLTYSIAGDYGSVDITEPYWHATSEESPVFAAVAEWNKKEGTSYPVFGERGPLVGAISCHEGQSTGHSCGEIKAVEVTAERPDKQLIEGIVMIQGPNLQCLPGDSGGPWMLVKPNDEAVIEGVHVGSAFRTECYYEPIRDILDAYELELLTTFNEIRPPSLPAKWLALEANVTSPLGTETTLEFLLEDTKTAIGKVAVLCGAVLAGEVSSNGGASTVTLLNLAKEEIVWLGLALLGTGTGSDCKAVSGCAEGTTASPIEVWAYGSPWPDNLFTMEGGAILELTQSGAYGILCLIVGIGVEDLCEASDSELPVANDPTSGAYIPAGSVASPSGTCVQGGAGSGVYEVTALSGIALDSGELLTVSE